MTAKHSREELEGMNNGPLRLIIAGIIGYEKRTVEVSVDNDHFDTAPSWFLNGVETVDLPNWPRSLDACVELWRFAEANGFDNALGRRIKITMPTWTMLVPPREHCIAFILSTQEKGLVK